MFLVGCSSTTTLNQILDVEETDVESIEVWELNANEEVEITDDETKEDLLVHLMNMSMKKTGNLDEVVTDELYKIFLRGPRKEFTIYSDNTASVNQQYYVLEDFDMSVLESFFE